MHSRLTPTFHVSQLKPIVPEPLNVDSSADILPAPLDVEGSLAYTVHRLLCSRRRHGGIQYLMDWEGYRPEERWFVDTSQVGVTINRE